MEQGLIGAAIACAVFMLGILTYMRSSRVSALKEAEILANRFYNLESELSDLKHAQEMGTERTKGYFRAVDTKIEQLAKGYTQSRSSNGDALKELIKTLAPPKETTRIYRKTIKDSDDGE